MSIFDALGQQYQTAAGGFAPWDTPWGNPNARTDGWIAGQRAPVMLSQGADGPNMLQGDYNWGIGLSPEQEAALQAAGFAGPTSRFTEGDRGAFMGYSPELQQWLANNGWQSRIQQGEAGWEQGLFDRNGALQGPIQKWGEGSDDLFGAAMLAGLGVAGGAAVGAGGGIGGTGGTIGAGGGGIGGSGATIGTGGLSSADLAALYGPAGYGQGMTAAEVAAAAGGGAGGLGGAAGGAGGLLGSAGNFLSSPAGIGALANAGAGLMGSIAAGKAADAQVKATQDANALQKYMFDTIRADNMPALQARNDAIGGLTNLLKNPGSVTSDPGYVWQRDQGIQGIDRSAAARGGLYSGATLKALDKYGTNFATTKLNDSYNRLASIAGVGQVGANTIGQAGQNYANQAGQNLIGAGNANASGYVGAANAWGNALQNAYNGWQQQNLLEQWMKRGGG